MTLTKVTRTKERAVGAAMIGVLGAGFTLMQMPSFASAVGDTLGSAAHSIVQVATMMSMVLL